jgi:hypothetical protein
MDGIHPMCVSRGTLRHYLPILPSIQPKSFFFSLTCVHDFTDLPILLKQANYFDKKTCPDVFLGRATKNFGKKKKSKRKLIFWDVRGRGLLTPVPPRRVAISLLELRVYDHKALQGASILQPLTFHLHAGFNRHGLSP